jgi:hypothetical protein
MDCDMSNRPEGTERWPELFRSARCASAVDPAQRQAVSDARSGFER